jgi:hypothetical protein
LLEVHRAILKALLNINISFIGAQKQTFHSRSGKVISEVEFAAAMQKMMTHRTRFAI